MLSERDVETMPAAALLVVVTNPDDITPGVLTFALEQAGRRLPSDQAVPALRRYLGSSSPLVREGAVLGLAYHTHVDGVVDELRALLGVEEVWGVMEVIREILEG